MSIIVPVEPPFIMAFGPDIVPEAIIGGLTIGHGLAPLWTPAAPDGKELTRVKPARFGGVEA